MEYGLIGAKLGHSYSKIIHEMLLPQYPYELHPLPTEAEARQFLEQRPFQAINVTIPYKQLVIPYCEEVDERAKAIASYMGAKVRLAFDPPQSSTAMEALKNTVAEMEFRLNIEFDKAEA